MAQAARGQTGQGHINSSWNGYIKASLSYIDELFATLYILMLASLQVNIKYPINA